MNISVRAVGLLISGLFVDGCDVAGSEAAKAAPKDRTDIPYLNKCAEKGRQPYLSVCEAGKVSL